MRSSVANVRASPCRIATRSSHSTNTQWHARREAPFAFDGHELCYWGFEMAIVVALLVGLCAGFVGSIPIAGPVAVLVLETGLRNKRSDALQIAVGAALAEGICAALAFIGVTSLLSRFPSVLSVERVVGAAVLVMVGVYFVVRKPKAEDSPQSKPSPRKWLLGLSITGLNPTILVTWTAVIAALHGAGLLSFQLVHAIPFAVGVTCGVILWFTVLIAIVRKLGKRLSPSTTQHIVHGMGYVLIAAGTVMSVRSVVLLLRPS